MAATDERGAHYKESYDRWVESLAAERPFGPKDKIGTANYIDDAARQRAAVAIRTGRTVSLARPLSPVDGSKRGAGVLSLEKSSLVMEKDTAGEAMHGSAINIAQDVLTVAPHGMDKTHLDAVNHIGRRSSWYSGYAIDDPEGPDLADVANHKLFTRGVLADITAVRGTEWVDPDSPVTGEDIDASLRMSGADWEAGDALLLYMGRDRFEQAGNVVRPPCPGAGSGAARWMVEHKVSLVCWDFLDMVTPAEPAYPVHLLIWAIGLLLVDNCNLRPAVDAAAESGSSIGGLVVGVPSLPGATGSLAAPLFIQ